MASNSPADLGPSQPVIHAARKRLIDALASPRGSAAANTRLMDDPINNVRSAPPDPAAVETSMAAEFPADVLRATDCFDVDEAGAPRLINGLRDPDASVILVRESPTSTPFAIVADGRPPARPNAADLIHDHETLRRIEHWGGVVIATSDVATAAAFIGLGLAAMPVADLTRCSPMVAAEFWKSFGKMASVAPAGPSNGRRPAPPPPPLHAVLVAAAWEPVACQPLDDRGAAAAQLLLDVQELALQAHGGVGLWRPGAETLSELRDLLAAGESTAAQDLVRQSLADDIVRLVPGELITESPVGEARDLIELRTRVLQAASSPSIFGGDEVDAKQAYLSRIEDEVIAPLLRAGGDTDPEDRVLVLTEATLFRRFMEADIDVAIRQSRTTGLPEDSRSVSELCALGAKVLEIHRARQGGRDGSRHRPRR